MDSFEKSLEHAFAYGNRLLEKLSQHWRKHTNRRTTLILIVAGSLTILSYVYVIEPPENFPLDTLVGIPSGTSLSETAVELQKDGVVRSGLALKLIVTLAGRAHGVHAGDYLFKEPKGLFTVAHAIITGAYGLEPVRIRVSEGATAKEMAVLFAGRLERFNAASFLSKTPSQEGYLFPDTYFFLPNATDDTVIETLRQNFDQHIATIGPQVEASGHSLSDIVIMASILEREAYNTKDRQLIAGVLWNRLARGMLLQVDATFAYTIGKGTFQLTMTDLTSTSPYNTYKHKGLPPTPIGSPSLDSLLAAATPTKSDYLYFLADRSGVTHYCKTYACQLANKARYF